MPVLRVALCQLNVTVGDFAGNVDRILQALDQAEANGADLAVFPELVVSGYPPEDLLVEPAFIESAERALVEVVKATRECVAVLGFVESVGGLFNAAVVASQGEVHGIWHKELLPNYGVFDERRWFATGNGDTPLFVIAGVRVGVTICEDAWSSEGPVVRQAKQGAELIVSLNASPYRQNVLFEREAMLAERAVEGSCSIVYVNLVGGQDELIFDGGSLVIDEYGTVALRAPQFVECIEVADIEITRKPRSEETPSRADCIVTKTRRAVPDTGRPPSLVAPLERIEEVYEALVLATRDYVEKNGFADVGVALSGGIDSALVAAIAVDALGAGRVHGVAMPSRFSSEGSLVDAARLAEQLDIDLRTIPIELAHNAFLELLAPSFAGHAGNLAEENIQARVRGTLMMGLSNKLGWLILTTGNKSETAVGYATLYGDMAGGFAVIKDVPKLLVYELCEFRNKRAGRDIIPQSILDKPPSAELRPDQLDEDSLPPYSVLDPILEGYIEYAKTIGDLEREG
ncbi:MAG TPA: NAD+ synthase, partial [Acidimicrobiales bacterium]|nr:NAD+ synthase [Acidimicrobiales bacterium]